MARFMSPAEALVDSLEHAKQVEDDLPRAQSRITRLFGDELYRDVPTVAPEAQKHVTSVERGTGSYAGFIFKCSCHAFGKWRRKESEAAADAKAHEAKPWAWKDRL
jgi:hypothetical protein